MRRCFGISASAIVDVALESPRNAFVIERAELIEREVRARHFSGPERALESVKNAMAAEGVVRSGGVADRDPVRSVHLVQNARKGRIDLHRLDTCAARAETLANARSGGEAPLPPLPFVHPHGAL